MRSPASSARRVRRSFSASEPSQTRTLSGRQSRAHSSIHAVSELFAAIAAVPPGLPGSVPRLLYPFGAQTTQRYSVARRRANPRAAPPAARATLRRSAVPRQAARSASPSVIAWTSGATSGTKKTRMETGPRIRRRLQTRRSRPSIPGVIVLGHVIEAEVHEIDHQVHADVAERLARHVDRPAEHPGRRLLAVEQPGQRRA